MQRRIVWKEQLRSTRMRQKLPEVCSARSKNSQLLYTKKIANFYTHIHDQNFILVEMMRKVLFTSIHSYQVHHSSTCTNLL